MAVNVIVNGQPVELDSRVYSWDANLRVIGSGAGSALYGLDRGPSEMRDPRYVWRTQPSVRTVVGFLASNIAQVPLHAFRRRADGDRERAPRSAPLSRLLAAPHPVVTPYEAMEELVIDCTMWDRFAALKAEPSGSQGVRLVRLPPWRWHFVRDQTHLPVAVEWARGDGSFRRFELDELLWLDGYWADEESTPIEVLFDILTEQAESATYRTELWRNGARMPGWIERPLDAGMWSTDARDKFRGGWQAYASGGVRAGRTPILEEGMKYHELLNGVTPRDGQQIDARKLSISQVAAVFHIPSVFVGLLDDTSRSNVSEYREQLYADVLGSRFQKIQQAYNARLVPDLADPDVDYVEFNVAEKLRLAFEEQARIFQTATGGPTMTRNEARQRMNLPRIDGADELIVPLNVIEGGQASPTDSAPLGGT